MPASRICSFLKSRLLIWCPHVMARMIYDRSSCFKDPFYLRGRTKGMSTGFCPLAHRARAANAGSFHLLPTLFMLLVRNQCAVVRVMRVRIANNFDPCRVPMNGKLIGEV